MRRRTVLGALGTVALAGCSSSDDGDDGESTTGTAAASTATGTPSFEFVGVEAPERIVLNGTAQFSVGVRNVGSGPGTFTTPLEERSEGGEWKEVGMIEMSLDAGETGEWRSPELQPRYLGSVEYRLPEYDERWTIEFVAGVRDFGRVYAAPNGLYVSVLGGSFEPTYPPDDGAEPGSGGVWAVMRVDVRNRLQEPQQAPEPSTFGFEVDGESRDPNWDVAADPYEARELAAREVLRGEFVYPVPEDTGEGDLRMWFETSLEEGDVRAIWAATE